MIFQRRQNALLWSKGFKGKHHIHKHCALNEMLYKSVHFSVI